MSTPHTPSRKEQVCIKELEMRFKDSLPPTISDDETLFYRFLKARNFDVDKAEIMLRKHIAWRKAYQLDTILDTYKPTEVILKYRGTSLLGLDKEGNLVRYSPVGNMDPRDTAKSVKLNDFVKYCVWVTLSDEYLGTQENMKSGRKAYQEIFIYNLAGVTFASLTNKYALDFTMRLTQLLQDNYPERMKCIFIINAPVYFTVFYNIITKMMSNAMLQKIRLYGQNGWKEALLELIEASVLPAFLGGERTDPDGDPNCRTTVIEGGSVPPKYFLTEEERGFKNTSKVESVVVPASSDHKILVELKVCDSVIRWEFETKRKDIGFGLFYQKTEEILEEVLPIQRILTVDGTEIGFFNCQFTGKYFIVFDNSRSWFNSREVFYCIEVENLNTKSD